VARKKIKKVTKFAIILHLLQQGHPHVRIRGIVAFLKILGHPKKQ
jgi:hypothetical protein